jgi:hypothetical protein
MFRSFALRDPTPGGNVTAVLNDPTLDLYLDLLKRSLLGLTYQDDSRLYPEAIGKQARRVAHDDSRRKAGLDWPSTAPTMIGMARIDNIQQCMEQVLTGGVPGDFIETGVWRGGAVIFMRGVLKAHGVMDRKVWVADSFQGLPAPDLKKYPQDQRYVGVETITELAIPLEEVKANFERYNLLDDQVRFLKGWFRDTLPTAPIEQLAIMRLDGDLYESTMDALTNLYDRLSLGGFVIVDDFDIKACREAVNDFRTARGIADEIVKIDWTGVYWRRTR